MPGLSADDLARAWMPIQQRIDVLENRLVDPHSQWIDLSRLVITTDAGMGKTCALEWLWAGLNRAGVSRVTANGSTGTGSGFNGQNGWLAFNLPPKELIKGSALDVHQRVLDYMSKTIEVLAKKHGCTQDVARQLVERHRRTGRLVILCDALDQMTDADGLHELLSAEHWKQCHFVLAGRPYSLQRYWSSLFNLANWRFLRVEELVEDQQRRYLGRDRSGQWRYDSYIPEATRESLAKEILTVPRVMKFLHRLPNEKLKTVRTSADVYYLSIYELIRGGMQESVDARRMNCDSENPPDNPQATAILKTFEMLAAVAFEMASEKISVEVTLDDGSTQWQERPNFFRVQRSVFSDFIERIEARFTTKNFQRDWSALSALNTVLTHAVFEEGVDGLVEVEFRNRSLQEFLCAYYLSQHAKPIDRTGGIPPDGPQLPQGLWNWIYLPLEPDTEGYYYVWQFLCEMHADAINPKYWLESIAPYFIELNVSKNTTKRPGLPSDRVK